MSRKKSNLEDFNVDENHEEEDFSMDALIEEAPAEAEVVEEFVPAVETIVKEVVVEKDESQLPFVYKRFDKKAVECLLRQSFKRLRGVYRSAIFDGDFTDGGHIEFALSLVVDTISEDGILFVPESYMFASIFDKYLVRDESINGFIKFRKP